LRDAFEWIMYGLKQHRRSYTVAARCALLMLCMLCACAHVAAQRRATPRPSPTPAADNTQHAADVDNADLTITAHVTARELRFEAVPNATVEFSGQPKRETVWDAQRQNLPRPVQPFTTYRDLGIHLVITSVFADIERIVAEALGEVPPPDENTQRDAAAPPVPSTVVTLPHADALPRRTPPPAAKTNAPPPRLRRARRLR
jgi:hypothetical protein